MNLLNFFSPIFQNAAVAVPVMLLFGTVIGSFLNVLIWRLPREEKPSGRSHCPSCSHVLEWYDLIPVVSFAAARGRCRYCKKPVSYRYPVIEIVTGLLFALAVWVMPPTDLVAFLVFAKALFIIAVAVVVFVVDIEHFLILDKIVFPSAAVILALLILTDIASGTTSLTVGGVLAAVGAFIPFWIIWYISKGKWMGFGDVKFMALMGLALGFPAIITALFVSFMAGALIGVILIATAGKNMNSRLPFGTFLSVATIVTLLFGEVLWQAYWGLFVV